jgi:hypothetical protein
MIGLLELPSARAALQGALFVDYAEFENDSLAPAAKLDTRIVQSS